MMEERCHATTQNGFYPDMSNVNKNITVEAKIISLPAYLFAGFFIKFKSNFLVTRDFTLVKVTFVIGKP